MKYLLDLSLLGFSAALLVSATMGNLVVAIGCVIAFTVYDRTIGLKSLRKESVLFRFLSGDQRETACYDFRQIGILVAMVVSSVIGQWVILIYVACAVFFYLVSSYALVSMSHVANAKFPFIENGHNLNHKVYNLVTDYSSDYRNNLSNTHKFSEIFLYAIPAAALWANPDVALVVGCVVGLVYALQFGFIVLLAKKIYSQLMQSSLDEVTAKIGNDQPEVMLYFSGGKKTTYQANMWLSVLERLDKKVMVLFRERHHIKEFEKTKIPLVFANTTRELEAIVPESVQVTLYVANVGKNVHWLRNVDNRHIFIGHGDSDKVGSAHNLMKAYDHMFVAGKAHINRMKSAGLDMPEDYYIHVGRPQLELFFGKA